jgi:hypothetical protein
MLRAGLRRAEVFPSCVLRHDFAALALPLRGIAAPRRARHALTLVFPPRRQ